MKESLPQTENLKKVLVVVQQLGFATYDHLLFEDLNFNIRRKEVTAITGKSGSGKSVILKILAGLEFQEEGKVEILPDTKTSYVPQELEDLEEIDKQTTIGDLFKSARGLLELERQMKQLERRMEADSDPTVVQQYGEIMQKYQDLDGWNAESEIRTILSALRVGKHTALDTRLGELSSGQLRKVVIGQALYSGADLVLMDDPTSHLDKKSVEWLSDYLRRTQSAIVLASNNRKFIDSCATQTIGLTDIGRVFVFQGGLTALEIKRDAIIQAEEEAAKSVQKKIKQLKETDRKFRNKQAYRRSADMAQVGRALQGRIQRLEEQHEQMPGAHQVFQQDRVRDLVFEPSRPSGNDVVFFGGLVKRYYDYEALRLKPEIVIRRGEKWLIWGPNGSGKSTLVRMIAYANKERISQFPPDEGEICIGSSVDVAYFSPDEYSIPRQGTLIDKVIEFLAIRTPRGKVAATLKFFGFSGQAVYHQLIETLSAGEKRRLALAIIMLSNPNFIILDEPTGDYMPEKIKSRLAHALNRFSGTALVVSHDLHFIKQLKITKTLTLPQGSINENLPPSIISS